MKFLQLLTVLKQIDELIQDPAVLATQARIAAELGCCDRQVRSYFEIFRELGAPLVSHARFGWSYSEPWSLSEALSQYR